MRASSYTALFRVSLRGVGLRCVGSGSKDICTLQHRFLCFLLFLYFYFYSLTCIITHVFFFIFLQRVPLHLEVGYEKSTLSRTETFSITICFKETLLFLTLFLKRTYFYLLFISLENMKLGPDKFSCFVTPKNCVITLRTLLHLGQLLHLGNIH